LAAEVEVFFVFTGPPDGEEADAAAAPNDDGRPPRAADRADDQTSRFDIVAGTDLDDRAVPKCLCGKRNRSRALLRSRGSWQDRIAAMHGALREPTAAAQDPVAEALRCIVAQFHPARAAGA